MLRQPIKKDLLSVISKDVVQHSALYLMEPKTGKVSSNWLQETRLLRHTVTKQQIVEVFHKLEPNPTLKLSTTKYIPSHFAQSQFGLQEITQPQSAPTYLTQPVNLPRPAPRRASGHRPSGSAVAAGSQGLSSLSRSINQSRSKNLSAPRSCQCRQWS